jgi:hypothetical protein
LYDTEFSEAMKYFIAILSLLVIISSPAAYAQKKQTTVPCVDLLHLIPLGCTPAINGSVQPSQLDIWKQIATISAVDLAYAKAMADVAATGTSANRSRCLAQIIVLNNIATGAGIKNPDGTPMAPPVSPHVFTDFEQLAEVVDALAPSGPLFQNCAAAAETAKLSVLQLVNAIIGGAAGLAVMGLP